MLLAVSRYSHGDSPNGSLVFLTTGFFDDLRFPMLFS